MDTAAPFKVILFDFGSTLIYSKDPWPPIYEQADRALVQVFQRAGVPLEIKAFSSEFETFLDCYYAERGASSIEKTTFSALQELLQKKGLQDIPDSVVRAALDAMYSITQQNWYLEADAIPTLKTLREHGYRLGMVSNTSDDENVQQLVDRWELRPFFENDRHFCWRVASASRMGASSSSPWTISESRPHRLPWLAIRSKRISWGQTSWAYTASGSHAGSSLPEEGELAIQPQAVIPTLDLIPGLLADIETTTS